jgi:hypothetical protein
VKKKNSSQNTERSRRGVLTALRLRSTQVECGEFMPKASMKVLVIKALSSERGKMELERGFSGLNGLVRTAEIEERNQIRKDGHSKSFLRR